MEDRGSERRGRHGSQVIIRGNKSHQEREQKAVYGQGDVEDAIWRYGGQANIGADRRWAERMLRRSAGRLERRKGEQQDLQVMIPIPSE